MDEREVFFDPADCGPRWRMDFDFLLATYIKATAAKAAVWPDQMNHLQLCIIQHSPILYIVYC